MDKLTIKQKEVLKELVDYKCEVCHKRTKQLIPHRIKRGFQGGKYIPRNIKMLCPTCHKKIHHLEFSNNKMNKKALFKIARISIVTSLCFIAFLIIFNLPLIPSDSPQPNSFIAQTKEITFNQNSEWYYLDIQGERKVGFDKDNGKIGIAKGNEFVGEIVPVAVVEYSSKYYLCPIINPTVDSKLNDGNNRGRYLSYNGTKHATCYEYDNYGHSMQTNININEMRLSCDVTSCKLSSDITFNDFVPQDTGFGYIFVPVDNTKFRYVFYEDKIIDLNNIGKITNVNYNLNFQFMDGTANSTFSVWEWEDMLTPETMVEGADIKTHFEVLEIGGKRGLLTGTYGYGNLTNIIVDPTQNFNLTSGICDFGNASCWTLGVVPVAGDDVIFNGTGTADCNITNNTMPQDLNSFTVESGYTGTIHFMPLFAEGDWTGNDDGGMLWNVSENIDISGGEMKIYGDYLHNLTTGQMGNISAEGGGQQWRSVNGNITVGAEAEVGGVGLGFPGQTGPGDTGIGGGTHGGWAVTTSHYRKATLPYGNASAPTSLGSGGNDVAGNGASAIKLHAVDIIEINGIINMSGKGSSASSEDQSGAGGSIWLKADNITGSGTIKADGATTDIDPGGGGRVRLEYGSSMSLTGAISVAGGYDTADGSNNADDGTLTFTDNTWPGDWTLTGDIGLLGGDYGEGNVTNVLGDFVLGSGYNITIYGDCFDNAGVPRESVCYNQTANGRGVWINASGNITISGGSTLYGYGTGFDAATGPAYNNLVGTHGGVGGGSSASTYGSETQPTSLGTGGRYYARGGSAVKLETDDGYIKVDGIIDMRGEGSANAYRDEGAAGGSIWLKADNITGTGTLKTDADDVDVTGGGGGRISLTGGSVVEFSGIISNKGGEDTDDGSGSGSGGTVYINASTSIISSMNISTVGLAGGNITFVDTLLTLSGIYNATNGTGSTTFETITLNYTDCSSSFAGATFNPGATYQTVCDVTGTNVWNCSSTQPFTNTSCWTLARVPVAKDDVVFNASAVGGVNITNNTMPQDLNSFTVESGYTGIIYFNALFAEGSWTGNDDGDMLWNVTENIDISGGEMKIYGDYLHNVTTGVMGNISGEGGGQQWRSVNGNVTVGSSAGITGAGLGFPTKTGPGVGNGGTHGGKGGGANPYGNASAPTSLGSGDNVQYADGGSAIKLHAVDLVEIQGTINMSGEGALRSAAGGSIWLKADNITGSGTVKADGGGGGAAGFQGGGGRIRLEYGSTLGLTGTISIAGGDVNAKSGTLTFTDNTWPGDWYVNGSFGLLGGDYGEGNVTNVLGDFVVSQGSNISIYGDCFYNATNPVTCYNTSAEGSGVWINASGNITISSGSVLDGVGLGFPDGYGPGYESSDGGTHGGKGGGNSKDTYGSETEPTSIGSGAHIPYGDGGSAVKLESYDTIKVDGDINIMGGSGSGVFRDGSGGSIWLKADNITGSGSIDASGGTGGYRAGGGGRISLTADSVVEFTGVVENKGGIASDANGGGGTVYINASTSIISSMNITTVGFAGGNITFIDTLLTLSGVYNASNNTGGQTFETIILNYTDCTTDVSGATFNPGATYQTACDATAPAISAVEFFAINDSDGQIGTDGTAFNISNLEDIEHMWINFTVTDDTAIDGDIALYYTANGTDACALGNNQTTTCYNLDSDLWIEFRNGTDTSTFRDIGGSAKGDYINCTYVGTTTQRNYTCKIDEHYNPNVWKHYPLNFSDVKWQSDVNERIKKGTIWRVELDNTNIPIDADYYKLDFRVNATVSGFTPAQQLLTYLCNSTYTYTNGTPESTPTCQLVGAKLPSELTGDGTKAREVFTRNITMALGDIKYVLIESDTPASKYYSMKTYGYLGIAGIRTSISTDKGGTYTVLADGYETELNLNWFDVHIDGHNNTEFILKVWTNDTLGNNANSSVSVMKWVAGELNEPPLVDIIVPEIDSNNSGTVQINWTTAEPNGDHYLTNITLHNGTAIASSLSSSTSDYAWDSSVYNGWWNITVTSWENETTDALYGNDSHAIYLDNIFPYFNATSPYNETVWYNNDTYSQSINMSDLNADCFAINDTTLWTINCSGWLTNKTTLSLGKNWLNVSINDTINNLNSSIFFVNVSTPPSIDTEFPLVDFVPPTPDNATVVNDITINLSIVEENLDTLIWTWNGTNYTIYNDSLLLMYNFENISALGENGTYVVDMSAHSNDAIIYGPNLTSDGRYNSAYNFSNNYIETNASLVVSGYPFTFEAWIRTENVYKEIMILSNKSDGTMYFGLGIDSDGDARAKARNSSQLGGVAAESTTKMNDYQWHHLVGIFKNDTYRAIYVDGVREGTSTASVAYDSAVDTFSVGRHPQWAQDFRGIIDEVRVWNRTLSSTEINLSYSSNLRRENDTQWYFWYNPANLSDGPYTYYGCAEDNSGNLNCTSDSDFRELILDTTPPYFNDTSPYDSEWWTNMTYEQLVNASDIRLNCFTVNDTINFEINCSGWLTNSTELSVYIYWLNISVNDTINNWNSSIMYINISALDDDPPTLTIHTPTSGTSYTVAGISILLNVTANDTASSVSVAWWSQNGGTTNHSWDVDDSIPNWTTMTWNQVEGTTDSYAMLFCANDTYDNRNCTWSNLTIEIPATGLPQPGGGGGASGAWSNWSNVSSGPPPEGEEPAQSFILGLIREMMGIMNWAAYKLNPQSQVLGLVILWVLILLLVFMRQIAGKIDNVIGRIKVRKE